VRASRPLDATTDLGNMDVYDNKDHRQFFDYIDAKEKDITFDIVAGLNRRVIMDELVAKVLFCPFLILFGCILFKSSPSLSKRFSLPLEFSTFLLMKMTVWCIRQFYC
jgi:hypothetical protein